MPTVLITGASRGIGLELARQYAARGWTVIATCRDPASAAALKEIAGVTIHPLDVANPASIEALAATIQGQAIDVLINNAGIGGSGVELGNIDLERWRAVLETNLLGPAAIIDALLPNVKAGQQKKIVSITSTLGSIARSTGGNYAYRSSKAALNMLMRSIAMDLKQYGITAAPMSPGIVDTDFTRGGRMPKISVQESVAGIIAGIDRMTAEQAGQFLRYTGETVEW